MFTSQIRETYLKKLDFKGFFSYIKILTIDNFGLVLGV